MDMGISMGSLHHQLALATHSSELLSAEAVKRVYVVIVIRRLK